MLGPGLKSTDQQLRDALHFFVSETGTSIRAIAQEAGVNHRTLNDVMSRGAGTTSLTRDKIHAALIRISARIERREPAAPRRSERRSPAPTPPGITPAARAASGDPAPDGCAATVESEQQEQPQ